MHLSRERYRETRRARRPDKGAARRWSDPDAQIRRFKSSWSSKGAVVQVVGGRRGSRTRHFGALFPTQARIARAMEPLAYQVVDAFTQSPLKGNPAAVVLLDLLDPRASDDSFLLNVAREFNFSETAYLVPLLRPTTPTYHLRWFTPEVVRHRVALPPPPADPLM